LNPMFFLFKLFIKFILFTTETSIRIHYALTDQMGIVYHGHYAQFYEIGRTEAIRSLGYTYKDIEALGIIMPVVDIHSKFLRPAKYDDLITVKTTLKEMPVHHKIVFHSEIYNQLNQLLNVGDVTLYFMEVKTMTRCEMPAQLKEQLLKYF
jgi:acyl-CoA thioester hydrolase